MRACIVCSQYKAVAPGPATVGVDTLPKHCPGTGEAVAGQGPQYGATNNINIGAFNV